MTEDIFQKILINYFILFSFIITPFLKKNSKNDWGEIYEERFSGNLKGDKK